MQACRNQVEPLKHSPEWLQLDLFDRFMKGFPVVGPEAREGRFLKRQMKRRSASCLDLWGRDCERVRLAREISSVLKRQFGWPTECFIPDDPFEILMFERAFVDMPAAYAVLDIEDLCPDVAFTESHWRWFLTVTFGEVVDHLLGKRSRSGE